MLDKTSGRAFLALLLSGILCLFANGANAQTRPIPRMGDVGHGKQLIVDGETYVQWYDCITDYVL